MSIDGELRVIFRRRLPQFLWTSVETGGTGQGVADSNYLISGGVEGWIEFKQTESYSIANNRSWPLQVAWLYRRARLGGRSWVAVRRRHAGGAVRGAAVDELWMIPGASAPELRASGLGGVRAAYWTQGGPSRWDWPSVAGLLLAAPAAPPNRPWNPAGDVSGAPNPPARGAGPRGRRGGP